jgi:8-oxo-dGTP pyrophosphatase MutT (NUDIX family)
MTSDRYRQRIPRPSEVRAGGPPPWSEAAPPAPNPTIDEIAEVLDPVESLAIVPAAVAAVLLPLIERPEGLCLLLIRRATSLSSEPGLIAFPGGRRDHDEPILVTALRETEEEIGLDRRLVTVLGALPAVVRGIDGMSVAPFVGIVAGEPTLVPNPDEVETVIEVPLAAFFGGGVAWEEIWAHRGTERSVHFFADDSLLGDDLIWGLSARILWDLLHRIWVATVAA